VFFTTAAQAASPAAAALRAKGARVYGVDSAAKSEGQSLLDVGQVLDLLRSEENCLYVLCEGGGRTALSLLEAGLVDEFHLHMAPLILADDEATPLFSGRHTESMEDALRMKAVSVSLAEGDVHIRFRATRG
jgi:diaminohydroxyphosphoribosylaminopyrimidine deaminase/5-amino-6-(5-phosphoribosylamino)uracil reductase